MMQTFSYESFVTGEKWEFPTLHALLAFLQWRAKNPGVSGGPDEPNTSQDEEVPGGASHPTPASSFSPGASNQESSRP